MRSFSTAAALCACLLAISIALPAQSQSRFPSNAPPRSSSGEDESTTFKVDVKLVNVFTTVVDEHGAPISSLRRDDFEVLEDGKMQKISVFDRESELPLSIVLAIDASLSTRKDLKLEVESARRFAHSILRPIDAMAGKEGDGADHRRVLHRHQNQLQRCAPSIPGTDHNRGLLHRRPFGDLR